ncbi:MAG: hypothetical protein A2X12_11005 [Bacteroidetes bacterium GWE2_29_8]|nr:MAG: hypothetical protein A2X12_11005 [Bacteroidetes bacterium GWE2_29_8]OFY22835.1 MAG: hypothetical protein A2X02_07120 [Bacteroidetes bacterium GWF2_29_10]
MKSLSKFNPVVIVVAIAISSFTFFMSFKTNQTNEGVVYVYKQITTVESIVPGGLGRSKMLETNEKGELKETSMENFYSMVGINFGNINSNDKQILNTINSLSAEGWQLFNVGVGVQSPSDKGQGIYMTRYLFRKEK